MAATTCPLCSKPVGLGTFFNQLWFTHIDCPSCGKRVKVDGVNLYYILSAPPAIGFGLMARGIHQQHGNQALLLAFGAFMLVGCVLLVVGLLTWMKLVKDEPS
jgi:hypothetical protein